MQRIACSGFFTKWAEDVDPQVAAAVAAAASVAAKDVPVAPSPSASASAPASAPAASGGEGLGSAAGAPPEPAQGGGGAATGGVAAQEGSQQLPAQGQGQGLAGGVGVRGGGGGVPGADQDRQISAEASASQELQRLLLGPGQPGVAQGAPQAQQVCPRPAPLFVASQSCDVRFMSRLQEVSLSHSVYLFLRCCFPPPLCVPALQGVSGLLGSTANGAASAGAPTTSGTREPKLVLPFAPQGGFLLDIQNVPVSMHGVLLAF